MNFKINILLILFLFCGLGTFAQKKDKKKKEPKTKEITMEKVSYAFGVLMANNLKKENIENLDIKELQKGISDLMKDKASMTVDEAGTVLNEFMMKQKQEAGMKNKEAGEKFLAENSKKDGVITLPSGLQYEVINDGRGEKPTLNSKVTTHYHGQLIDGTVFDSSVERGQPATFPVGGVIKGWTEALQLMGVGSKWKLYIPYDLAYGDRGAGPKIGPYTALIFTVELLSID